MLTLACGAAAFMPMPTFGRGRAQPSSAVEMSAGAPAAVFIKDVAFAATADDVARAAAEFGDVAEVWLPAADAKRHPGECKGFGKVTFASADAAAAALEIGGVTLGGRKMRFEEVHRSQSRDGQRKALRRARRRDEVTALLAELRPLQTVAEATAAIGALARVGEREAALAELAAVEASSTFAPDVVAYTAAFGACASGEAALALLDRMGERGVDADARATNAAIAAAARGADATVALELLEGLGRAADVYSFTSAIAACSAAGEPLRALALLRDMEGARGVAPDVRCYNAALHACAEGRLPEEALALLKRMAGRRGLAPDAVSYNTALTACAKGLRHTEGLAVLDEMRAAGVKPDAHTYSAALACCDDAERANELLAQMRAVGVEPDGVCYGAAIAACARGGEAASADALLREQARRGVRPTVVAHKAAIAAFAREGDWRRALELLDDLEADAELRKQMGAETFVGAMQAVAAAGRLREGFALLERAMGVAGETAEEEQASYVLHRALLEACRAHEDLSGAARVQASIERRGLRPTAPRARCCRRPAGDAPLACEEYENGGADDDAADVAVLCNGLRRRTAYVPQLRALPLAFVEASTKPQQRRSLLRHAEKRALAAALETHDKGEAVSIDVNFKMCADCHAFVKAASQLTRRRITVREPALLHTFVDGECSCGDRWRWEERVATGAVEAERVAAAA